MGRQIIIGKEGNQPFAIYDPKVSRRHAVLQSDDQGRLFLIDNNSTNGTYLYNGYAFERIAPNTPYPVTPESMIQLGPETRFHVRRLLSTSGNAGNGNATGVSGGNRSGKEPKRVDIKPLRKISEDYSEKKMELESKAGSINGLRSLTILVSMVAGATGPVITQVAGLEGSSATAASLGSIGVGIILMMILLMVINKRNKQIIKDRAANEKEYAVKYCCPVCGASFRGKIYENVLSERQCPKCKTQYYDSDIKN